MSARLILIGMALCLLAGSLQSQYIVAGEHTTGDRYVDLDPDQVVLPVGDCDILPAPGYFYLDLDGNGEDDFYIRANCWYDYMTSLGRTVIKALNNNRVLSDSLYQCWGVGLCLGCNLVEANQAGDTIGPASAWDTITYAFLSSVYNNISTYCYCTTFGYSGYVGVSVVTPWDTLYGWIRVGANSMRATVYEYACNMNTHIGMAEHGRDYAIYPNPGNGRFTVVTGSPGAVMGVIITDLRGCVVWRSGKVQPGRIDIDVSHLPGGIYICRIEEADRTRYEKIILK